MSNVLGHLTDIIGTVQIKHEDGTLEMALNNAIIVEGDTVVNSVPNSATIILNNGREVPVEGNSYTIVDMTIAGPVPPADTQADGEDVDLALLGEDFDEIETAAGEETGSSTYYESEYTDRTGATNDIGAKGGRSSSSYSGGDISDYRTDEDYLNTQNTAANVSASGADSRGNLEVSVSTSFPGSSTFTSSARVGAPSFVPTKASSGVSDIDESQGEVYVTFTSDRAFGYDTQLHFDFLSGEGKADWADDYTFPMQYTTDGGLTWNDMEAFNVTMEAGKTELILRVNIFDDGVVENTEQFLANVSSADFNSTEVDFNIHDNDFDDGTPLLAVDFAYVVEGMEYAEYHITLDKPAEGEVSINYYTTDFGATAGEDYTPVSGTAVFAEGQTEVVVRVPIIDDALIEDTELAFFNLDPNSLEGNVKLADIQGSLRIFDNDGEANSDITVSLDTVTVDNTINSTEAGSSVNITGSVVNTELGVDLVNGVVVLTINGQKYSNSLNSDGTFSITVDGSALAQDGDSTIEAAVYAEDTTGTYQRTTTTGSYSVDIDAPDAPEITLVTDSGNASDTITNNGAYTVTPSEATSTVEYSLDGGETWSETAPVAETDGEYSISVRETDTAGNVSPIAVLAFTLDTTAPDAPEVVLANDTSGTELITKDGTLAVTPNEPTSSIEYSIDGGETWIATAPEATEGENRVSVREVDVAGNVSLPASITFTLDTTAPDAPEITNIIDTNGDFAEVTLYGRGSEAGNVVTLYNSGVVVGTAVVGADLTWSVDVTDIPKSGNETLTATESDVAGNESALSTSVNYAHNDWSNSIAESSDDYVFKGEGNDKTTFAVDDANNSYVYDGGQGEDTLSFEGNANGVNVNLAGGEAASGDDNIEIRNTENITGSSHDDVILGDANDNTLRGGEGNDDLRGGQGNDSLDGGLGADTLRGGAGDDSLYGDRGNDTISGGKGDDDINGGAGDDVLRGNAGDDYIIGRADNDTLFGGAGDDTLHGDEGKDVLRGGTGNDDLAGGNHDDTLYGGQGDDKLDGGRGDDTLIGGQGDDVLLGAAGDDVVRGGAGDDIISGGEGDDFLYGGKGEDTLLGSDGDDNLHGGQGNDSLDGGLGNDVLRGGTGDDSIYGDRGDDTVSGGTGDDNINGGAGDDILRGNAGDDYIIGRADNDTLFGGSGDDTLHGDEGDDVLRGGTGNDDLAGGNHNDILYGGQGDDKLDGGRGDDVLHGGQGDDVLLGAAGDDVVRGGAGDDIISGGEGDDFLYGGKGDDTLFAGSDDEDIVFGGAGEDTIIYEGTPEEYTVTLNPDGTYNVEDVDGNIDVVDQVENITFRPAGEPPVETSLDDLAPMTEIVDVNETANVISEDVANGTEVGIQASSIDGTGDTVTYAIVDSNGDIVTDGPFAIDGETGVVTVQDQSQINYETASSHEVIIQANSSDGSSTSKAFSVDVSDVDFFGTTDLGGDVNGEQVSLILSGDHYTPNATVSGQEDVGEGSPQYQIYVNGEPFGDVQTVTANRGYVNEDGNMSRDSREFEVVTFKVPEGTDISSVTVRFINDKYDGTNDRDGDGVNGEDRNLFVDAMNIGGSINPDGSISGGTTYEAEDASSTQYLATNGLDVSGREIMPWAGAMTFYTEGVAIETPTVDLVDTSDTGVSNSDNLTSDATPTMRISIGEGAATNNTINIVVDGSVVATHVITTKEWRNGFADVELAELADGSHDISAAIVGNNATSESSLLETIVVDTGIDTLASGEPITAALTDESNSGSTDDRLTNDNTPTIAGQTEPGALVEVLNSAGDVIGATRADGDGNYEITTPELPEGANPLEVRVTDDAGNSASTEVEILVDTLATSAPRVEIGNGDENVTRTELDADGNTVVRIMLPNDSVEGDVLNVTGPDGTVTSVEVTQDILNNGYETSYPTPEKGEEITISASVTDQAGNTSTSDTSSARVQTDPDTAVILQESFENLRSTDGWHVATGDVTGDNGVVWDTGSNGIEVQRGIVSGSSDGQAHAELDAHHNISMTATVALTASSDYTLAFDVKPRNGGASRDYQDTSDMKITLGDIEVAVNSDVHGNLTFETNHDTVVVKSFTNPDTGWSTVVVEYVDISGTTIPVTVEGTGADDSYGMLLDNMSMLDAIDEYSHVPVVPVVNTNIDPEAETEEVSATEDTVVTGQIDASDANGDNLTFAIAEDTVIPTGLVVNSDGSYSFDASSYDGLSEGEIEALNAVEIVITDGHGGQTTTTLSVDVSGVNNDLTYVSEAAGYSNVVGYYEVDANGEPLSPVVVSIDNQNGLPSGLHLNDLNPNTSYGFFILANGANEVDENSTLTFDTTGVQPVLLIDGEPASHPVYHDTPEFNFDGKDHFVFNSDGQGGTDILMEDLPHLGDADFRDVVLNVNFEMADKIGDDVRVRNDSVATVEGTQTVIDASELLANDKDATGDSLQIIAVTATSNTHGTVALDSDGNVVYTPEVGFNGDASFNYTVSDGNEGSGTGRVNVHVSDLPEITNIVDVASDYSQVILSGTGEPGATITLFNKSGHTTNGNTTNPDGVDTEIYPSTTVTSDGTWNIDISNLSDTPVNDNEFFTATQLDSFGNEAQTQGAVHYWHGTWGSASTEVADDYVMMGNGNDRLHIRSDDVNNALVVDGGNGNDKAIFNGKFSDYTIDSVGGNIIVREPNGDVNELRNFENISFHNAVLMVATMQVIQTSGDISNLGDIGENNSSGDNPSETETFTYDFGASLAGQTVTLSFNSEAVGTWDQAPATSDVFTVNANGVEVVQRRYDHKTDDDNTWNETHSFDVVLDEDGKANVTFDVATTGTDEKVSFSDIQVTYNANDTFVYDGTAIDAGLGEDILVMNDTLDIDFDALAANVDNIEVLAVNSVANLTNINAEDIIDLTDDDNILEIHSSDTANTLTLDSNEWSVGTNTADYNEFVSTVNDETVTLRVENTIIIDNN